MPKQSKKIHNAGDKKSCRCRFRKNENFSQLCDENNILK